jgi:hypothetical protein
MCEVAALLVEVSVDVVVSSELSPLRYQCQTNGPTLESETLMNMLSNCQSVDKAREVFILREATSAQCIHRRAGVICSGYLARSRGLSILNANGAVYTSIYNGVERRMRCTYMLHGVQLTSVKGGKEKGKTRHQKFRGLNP